MKRGIRIMRCSNGIQEIAVIKVKDFVEEAQAMMRPLNDLKKKTKGNLRQDFFYVEETRGNVRIFYVSTTGDPVTGPNPEPFTELILAAEER